MGGETMSNIKIINNLKISIFFIGIGAIIQRNIDVGFNELFASISVLLLLIFFYLFMSFLEKQTKLKGEKL